MHGILKIPLFHFSLVLFQIALIYFTYSCKLILKTLHIIYNTNNSIFTKPFFFQKGPPRACSKKSSKDLNVEIREMVPLQQTVACEPHHPNLFDCLNKMFSSFLFMVWWNLSRAPWNSGWCALDWNCFMFSLIDA